MSLKGGWVILEERLGLGVPDFAAIESILVPATWGLQDNHEATSEVTLSHFCL